MAAILAGALRCLTAFWDADDPGTAAEIAYLVIDAALLFGITGFYARHHRTAGQVGFAGFFSTIIGLCLIVGPDGDLGGTDLYPIGAALIGLGVAALAWVLRRRDALPTWSTWSLVAAVPVGAPGDSVEGAFAVAGLLFGIGIIGAGRSLLATPDRHHGDAAPRPERPSAMAIARS
jgi:hypothetical protein